MEEEKQRVTGRKSEGRRDREQNGGGLNGRKQGQETEEKNRASEQDSNAPVFPMRYDWTGRTPCCCAV